MAFQMRADRRAERRLTAGNLRRRIFHQPLGRLQPTGSIAVAVTLAGFTLAAGFSSWPEDHRRSLRLWFAGGLIGWFAVAAILAYFEVFRGAADRWPTIQFAILLPIVIGLAFLWRSRIVTRVLESIPQSWIVGVQFYRVLGVIFVLLLMSGHLPPHFALPAGWGDVAVGLSAPLVALAYARGAAWRETAVRAWNIIGLLDLVVAVAMGVLTSPSPFQQLSLQSPNELISAFPLVLVPAFAVPLSVLLHAASLLKLARERDGRQAHVIGLKPAHGR